MFLSGAASTPIHLAKAMTDHGKSSGLKDIVVCHMHTEGDAPYTNADCVGEFPSIGLEDFVVGSLDTALCPVVDPPRTVMPTPFAAAQLEKTSANSIWEKK